MTEKVLVCCAVECTRKGIQESGRGEGGRGREGGREGGRERRLLLLLLFCCCRCCFHVKEPNKIVSGQIKKHGVSDRLINNSFCFTCDKRNGYNWFLWEKAEKFCFFF